jgi:hypothetical protein
MELLAGCQISEVVFLKSSILVTLEEHEFARYFASRYEQRYAELEGELECLQEFLRKIPKVCKYMLLSKVERRVYALGEKIVLKGEHLDNLIIVGDKLRDEELRYIVKGCIGLYEFKKGKAAYEETVYCPKQ